MNLTYLLYSLSLRILRPRVAKGRRGKICCLFFVILPRYLLSSANHSPIAQRASDTRRVKIPKDSCLRVHRLESLAQKRSTERSTERSAGKGANYSRRWLSIGHSFNFSSGEPSRSWIVNLARQPTRLTNRAEHTRPLLIDRFMPFH